VVFVFASWVILLLAYFLSALFSNRMLGGSLLAGFNAYSLIMFATLMIGLFFFWRLNPNGYLILAGVCFFNIFRIIALMRFPEILIWLYPVISLVVVRKYFLKI
jgi:hypothetical protein